MILQGWVISFDMMRHAWARQGAMHMRSHIWLGVESAQREIVMRVDICGGTTQ